MQLQTFTRNVRGRDFAIGDLHGCHEQLASRLTEADFDTGCDRLFSVGDLIDRGPDSLRCLQLVFEPWFFAIRGNHEQMMLDAFNHASPHALPLWYMNGGRWLLEHDQDKVAACARAALIHMPYAIEVDVAGKRVGLVHAEVPDHDWHSLQHPLSEPQFGQLLWARERIARRDPSAIAHIDLVLVGHSIVPAITRLGNTLYIDTGAFSSRGRLTLLEIQSWL
ncbi:metallophosphoesterase [Zobellella sp. DQSA1]|uniref:metallophosphoesterase n=1 Tax=Zobellella sp. DQSA1 TaxID=3342386 RepID=UPI0035C0D82E